MRLGFYEITVGGIEVRDPRGRRMSDVRWIDTDSHKVGVLRRREDGYPAREESANSGYALIVDERSVEGLGWYYVTLKSPTIRIPI